MAFATCLEIEVANSELGCNLKKIKDNVAGYLEMMTRSNLFSEYTNHGITHSEEMLKKCEWLIPTEVQLNDVEKYLLVMGAYFHDIGMVATQEDIDNILKGETLQRTDPYYIPTFDEFKEHHNYNKDNNSPEALEHYIRTYHHIRSAEIVKNKCRDFMIEKILSGYIEEICKSHCENNLEVLRKEVPIEFGNFSDNVNCQYVAIILRLADILDVTHARTSHIVFDSLPICNKISKKEWERQFSTSGVKPSAESPKIINFGGNYNDPDLFFALEEYSQLIQCEIDYCRKTLNTYSQALLSKYYLVVEEVSLKSVNTVGFEKERIEFTVDRDNIVKLFMGNNLYREKDYTVVRELLINAIDACFLRRSQEGASYEPVIKVKLDSKENSLTVSDNGTGMDRRIVKDYLLKIGKSKYNPSEFDVKTHGYYPISKFGIGFLSIFLIANKVEIFTRHFKNNEMFAVIINDLQEYIIFKDLIEFSVGTDIKIFLDKEIRFNILAIVKYWIKHLDIPIEVIIDGEVIETISNDGFDTEIDFHYTLYEKEKIEDIKQITINIDTANIKGNVWLIRDNKNRILDLFRLDHADDIYINNAKKNVSYAGVLVSNTVPLPDYWKLNNFLFDLDISNSIIKLEPKLDRNSLKINSDYLVVCDEIEEQLVAQLSEFMKENMDDNTIGTAIVYLLFEWRKFRTIEPSNASLSIILKFPWFTINGELIKPEDVFSQGSFYLLPTISLHVFPHLFPSEESYNKAIEKCNVLRTKYGKQYLDIPNYNDTKEFLNIFSSPESVEIHREGFSLLKYTTDKKFDLNEHFNLRSGLCLCLPFIENNKQNKTFFATVVGPYVIINKNHPAKNLLDEAINNNYSKEAEAVLSFIKGNSGFCLITDDKVLHLEAHLEMLAEKLNKDIKLDIEFADYDYMEYWI